METSSRRFPLGYRSQVGQANWLGHVEWEKAETIVRPQINMDGIHMWPFDHSCPIEVRFFSLNRSHDLQLHRPDHLELIYLESSEIIYQVEQSQCLLQKGDLAVVGNRRYHRCRKTQYRHSEVLAIVLLFLPDLIRAAAPIGDDIRYLSPFMREPSGWPLIVPAKTGIPTEISELIHRIHSELPPVSGRSRLAVRTYLKMILLLLLDYCIKTRQAQESFEVNQLRMDRLCPVFEFMETYYGEPVRVLDAASVIAMSESRFMRYFKEATGQSFISYLNGVRLAKAQALLASTDKSVAEVSHETGFCDQSYFGVVFRKQLHMSPLEYRRKVQAQTSIAVD